MLSVNFWVFSQGNLCGKKFRDISHGCISDRQEKMDNLQTTLASSRGGIYFYKDSGGNLGKIHIYSILNNTPRNLKSSKFKVQAECVAYYHFYTFLGKKSYSQSGSLNIQFDRGDWSIGRLDLSGRGGTDLVLKANNGYCILESENNAKFALYKRSSSSFTGQGSEVLYYSIYFLIGLAVFLVAFQVFQDNSRFQASETLESDKKEPPQDRGFVLKYSRPFFKRYFSPIVSGMKGRRKIRDKYRRKLAAAGLTRILPPDDFFAWKLFLIIAFPIVFLALRTFLETDWSLAYTFILPFVGYIYPDMWLSGEIKKRQDEIVMNMPFVVDMLALSIEAGLDFINAIAKVIEKAPPSALVEEFEIMLKENRVGASRAEALRQFSWRNDSIAVSSFCATLISADSVGASIGPILKVLGAEMRQKRSAEVEKKAAAAATKMLLPMMFFILPAIMIVIMAPLVVQMMSGG